MGRTGSTREYMSDIALSNIRQNSNSNNDGNNEDENYEVIEFTVGTLEEPASLISSTFVPNTDFTYQYEDSELIVACEAGGFPIMTIRFHNDKIDCRINTCSNLQLLQVDVKDIEFGGDPTINLLDAYGDIVIIYNQYKLIIHCYVVVIDEPSE